MFDEMTDRERILTTIITQLHATQVLGPDRRDHYDPEKWGERVHFAKYRKPVAGELVFAATGREGRWKIGWFVEETGCGSAVIREIGSKQVCNYSNEEFVPIVGLRHEELLEGDKYRVYVKIRKAIAKLDDFWHRLGRCEIRDTDATIMIREAFNGHRDKSTPYAITIQWDKNTTIKAIKQMLLDGGYGTRSFRPEEQPAT